MSKVSVLLVILVCIVTGCSSSRKKEVIIGSIRQENRTDNKVWVEELRMGGMNHRAGILIPGGASTMGFARIVISEEVKLVYEPYSGEEILDAKTVYFDCSRLTNIAREVRFLYFSYEFGDKWLLRVYDRSKVDEGFEEDQFLGTVLSQTNQTVSQP